MTNTLTALDLFSGAGGLTLGLHRSGFATVGAVEIDDNACATYNEAFPSIDLRQADVREVNFRQWEGVDLVVGGPPCQPFSSGGLQRGREDSRDFLPEFVRAVIETRPRAFLMENVPGLASFSDYLQNTLSPLIDSYRIL